MKLGCSPNTFFKVRSVFGLMYLITTSCYIQFSNDNVSFYSIAYFFVLKNINDDEYFKDEFMIVRDFYVYLRKLLKTNIMKQIIILLLLMAVSVFSSCEKFNEDEVVENKEANSTLIVRTMAAANDGTESGTESIISYPINIYVFDESNECVAVSTLSSADDELSLKLPEGMYEVCAVAGASADSYELPTQETATKETVLTLKDGQKHGDLMTANNTVTLEYGGTNTLTLALERKVMLIESVTINNVPASVSNVSVSIHPLKANLLLDGSYSGENGASEIELTEDVDGSTWKNTDGVYLLEAVGRPTVEVTFTINGETVSYSYTCDRELKANHKVFITGTFTGDGIEMTGSISGVEWAEDEEIEFDFGGKESGGTDDNGDVETSDVPTVGTLYKGCYVLKSETNGGMTTLTLMYPENYSQVWGFDKDDQESIEAELTTVLAGLSVEGISTEWRLPTLEEIEILGKNYNEINEKIKVLNESLATNERIDLIQTSNNTYFFIDADSSIKTYNPVKNEPAPSIGTGVSTLLRAFTTQTIAD